MSQSITDILPNLKTQYLDNRNIGIRKFAELSSIRRSRLKILLEKNGIPTEMEIVQISIAMERIEVNYTKRNSSHKPPTPVAEPIIQEEPQSIIKHPTTSFEQGLQQAEKLIHEL